MGEAATFWILQVLALLATVLPVLCAPHWLTALLPPIVLPLLCAVLLIFYRLAVSFRATAPHATWKEHHLNSQTEIDDMALRGDDRSSALWVVDVRALSMALASRPAADVLNDLFTRNSLLVPATTASKFALISYRQQRSKDDDFTLDTDALLSVVSKATAAGVEFLWLDAWCYRTQGEYDHELFCSMLADVVGSAYLVIWLPRSRNTATSSYQFRLWCTFEACAVAQRGLPVIIAGVGPSKSQLLLCRLGVFLPWLPFAAPPPEGLEDLATYNLAYMLVCLVCPLFILVWISAGNPAAVREQMPSLARQLAWARNGQLVLRVMLQASGSAGSSKASDVEVARLAEALREELPWLPCYDRRDVLVVRELLDTLRDTAQHGIDCSADDGGYRRARGSGTRVGIDAEAYDALVLSAYTAALQRPSDGDRVDLPDGSRLPVGEWLEQKHLEAWARPASPHRGGGHGIVGRRDPGLAEASREAGVKRARKRSSMYRLSAYRSSVQPEPDEKFRVPLAHLRRLGWTFDRGASCQLTTPLGPMHVPPPKRSIWTLDKLSPCLSQEKYMRPQLLATVYSHAISAANMLVIWVTLAQGALLPAAPEASTNSTDATSDRASAWAPRMLGPMRDAGQFTLPILPAGPIALFLACYVGPALAYTSQCSAAPHFPDLFRPKFGDGYHIMAMVHGALANAIVAGILVIPTFLFLEGRWPAFDASPGSSRALESSPTAIWCWVLMLAIGLFQTQTAAARAYHMAARGARDGPAHVLYPPHKKADGVAVMGTWSAS